MVINTTYGDTSVNVAHAEEVCETLDSQMSSVVTVEKANALAESPSTKDEVLDAELIHKLEAVCASIVVKENDNTCFCILCNQKGDLILHNKQAEEHDIDFLISAYF